jgi:hypothetical protein
MKVFDFAEILMQKFFQNLRDVHSTQAEGQTTLSLALWTLEPVVGTGETFIEAHVWHENLDKFMSHHELIVKACRLSSMDGLKIISAHPTQGDQLHKLLRVS